MTMEARNPSRIRTSQAIRKQRKHSQIIHIDEPVEFLRTFYSEDEKAPEGYVEIKRGFVHTFTGGKKLSLSGRLIGIVRKALASVFRMRWFVLFLLVIGVGIADYWAYREASPDYIQTCLMREKRYLEAGDAADRIMAANPRNEDMAEAGLEAFLAHILSSNFEESLENGDFLNLRRRLTFIRRAGSHIPGLEEQLNILNWMLDVEAYFHQKTSTYRFTLFRDEYAVARLLKRWRADQNAIVRLMGRISRFEKSETMQKRIYRHLDLLQALDLRYTESIKKLKKRVALHAADGEWSLAEKDIAEFDRNYPGVGNLDLLRKDLSVFQSIYSEATAEQDGVGIGKERMEEFRTDVFRDLVRRGVVAVPTAFP